MSLHADLFSENESLRADVEGLKIAVEKKDERLANFEDEVTRLHEMIRDLKRMKFGTKSERWESPEQALLFNEAESHAKEEPVDNADDIEINVAAHTKKRGHRRPLPADLEREIVIIDLPDSEKFDDQGNPLRKIGEEVSEKFIYSPAEMKVLQIHRIRYGVDSGDKGKIAPPPPSIIPKGIVTSSLLAHIVLQKYGYGLPLYRQEEIFSHMGVDIPRCTMARWIVQAAEALRPIWNILEDWVMASPYVSVDETYTQVLKEKGRTAQSQSWMWVRCTPSDERKIILFDYDPSRAGAVVKKLFTDYRGVVQCDGYAGYNELEKQDGVTRIGCNMHGRRKFEAAFRVGAKNGKSLGEIGLGYYKRIYQVETEARGKPADQRYTIRNEKAQPVWNEFKKWADKTREKVPPKSKIGEAFRYFINEYDYLTGYMKDGTLEADNGFAERAIKSFAIGRKNWLFSDSTAGADASALFYSVLITAKINGVDPYKALVDIFDQVPLASTIEDFERIAAIIVPRAPAL